MFDDPQGCLTRNYGRIACPNSQRIRGNSSGLTSTGQHAHLELIEDGIADTGHEHHRDQERDKSVTGHGVSNELDFLWNPR